MPHRECWRPAKRNCSYSASASSSALVADREARSTTTRAEGMRVPWGTSRGCSEEENGSRSPGGPAAASTVPLGGVA
jgi:hypothetical protein